MKKTYFAPATEVLLTDCEELMGVSGDNGIRYGGVDTEGTMEPEEKGEQPTSVWEDEE